MKSTLSRTKIFVVILLAPASFLLAGGSPSQLARRRRPAAPKLTTCQACHGLDGLSKTPDALNIAGQTEPYLVAQLQAYKSGLRKNDAMSVVTPPLSDRGH